MLLRNRLIPFLAVALALVVVLPAAAKKPNLLTPVTERPPAPDFVLADLDGAEHRLADYRGRVVIVNFWATWCPPCRFEIPSMSRAWKQIEGTEVVMLAIHIGGDEDSVWQFIGDMDIEFPVLMDIESKAADAYPMPGLPTTFVVGPDGRIELRAIGGREWDDPKLLEQIRALAKP